MDPNQRPPTRPRFLRDAFVVVGAVSVAIAESLSGEAA